MEIFKLSKRYVIIGASAAAIGAINGIRRTDQDAEIICISAEKETPYNKCFLADVLAGKKGLDQVSIFNAEQQQIKNVQLIVNTRITHIDHQHKMIHAANGFSLTYDSLLIATGSSPYVPSIEGIKTVKGIFTFHTSRDVQDILAYIDQKHVKRALIVGAGLSGLECGDSLRALGLAVSIIEMKGQVLSTQLDVESAHIIAMHAQRAGIDFYFNEQVISLKSEKGLACGVKLASGKELQGELIIFATGLRPNSQIALEAGIAIENGGIMTNEYMQTSHPDIYAAGDVALVKNQINGEIMLSFLWPDAMLQGMIAGQSMAGSLKYYGGAIPIMSSAFFGIKMASYGMLLVCPLSECSIEKNGEDFSKIFIENDAVSAFSLIGSLALLGKLRRVLLTKSSYKTTLLGQKANSN